MKIDELSRFRLFENGTVTITRGYGSNFSDEHREQVRKHGLRSKHFRITNGTYRKIVSSSVNLYRGKVNKVIFLTLTFPSPYHELRPLSSRTKKLRLNHDANKSFSKFIENLKQNYGLENYVAVKENTQIGIPHYHILADFPFKDIRRINSAWCATFPNYIQRSKNAARLPKDKAVVKNLHRTVKYICKYFTKSRNVSFNSRCYFLSHDILSRPAEIDYEIGEELINKFTNVIRHYQYCSVIYLNNVFSDYEFIAELLNIHRDPTEFSPPLNTS